MMAQTYGGLHYLQFLDAGWWGEVCQNLIKLNEVGGIRSGWTYL